MDKYTVRPIVPDAPSPSTKRRTREIHKTALGNSFNASLSEKAYTAYVNDNCPHEYNKDDIVVCKFKAGLCLCMVTMVHGDAPAEPADYEFMECPYILGTMDEGIIRLYMEVEEIEHGMEELKLAAEEIPARIISAVAYLESLPMSKAMQSTAYRAVQTFAKTEQARLNTCRKNGESAFAMVYRLAAALSAKSTG